MKAENADWTPQLRLNAASCELAIALHAARCEAYQASGEPFERLPMHIKRAYIDAAHAILKATKPTRGLPDDLTELLPMLARAQMKAVTR